MRSCLDGEVQELKFAFVHVLDRFPKLLLVRYIYSPHVKLLRRSHQLHNQIPKMFVLGVYFWFVRSLGSLEGSIAFSDVANNVFCQPRQFLFLLNDCCGMQVLMMSMNLLFQLAAARQRRPQEVKHPSQSLE